MSDGHPTRAEARARIVVLLVLAAALVLGGCGGDSSETTAGRTRQTTAQGGSEAGPSPAASAAAARRDSAAGAESSAEQRRKVARERVEYERRRYGSPSKRSSSFHGSASKGSLKHLPEFGSEAAASERGEAQAVLGAYLAAVSANEWDRACGYLLPLFVSTFEEAARAEGGGASGCAEILRKLSEEAAAQPGPHYPAAVAPQVASFRIEPYPAERAAELHLDVEAAGFALIHGPEGVDYYASLTREGGKWQVTVPSPAPLG